MLIFWKFTLVTLFVSNVVVDGNRARRQRRQTLDQSKDPIIISNLPSNTQASNNARQSSSKKHDKSESISGKTVSRQFYPFQRPYGYGSIQGINYPYAGSGVGLYQYGYGEYGQYGQGSNQYAAYYNNRYPGAYSFYPGFNSINFNDPNNYRPPSPGLFAGYYWNSASKHNRSTFNLCFFSLLVSIITYEQL